MLVAKKLLGCSCVAVALLITGCATPDVVALREPGASSATASQALKIRAFGVKWRENPDFKISLERTMPTFLTALVQTSYEVRGVWHPSVYQPIATGIPESSKALADAYIGEILGLFRARSSNLLKSELQARGLRDGTEMEITITPLSGFQSIDGWGTNVLFRTEFVEQATARKWFVDVMVKSGIHWTGVANAAKPTTAFIEQYVENLADALRKEKAF